MENRTSHHRHQRRRLTISNIQIATVSFYICSALSVRTPSQPPLLSNNSPPDGHDVRLPSISSAPLTSFRNKWVLTTTTIPLTFLALQILITILLLQASRTLNLFEFKMPSLISLETAKGLKYLTLLNLAGLTYVVNTNCYFK